MQRCASSPVIAAYAQVRLLPHDSHASPLKHFTKPPNRLRFDDFFTGVSLLIFFSLHNPPGVRRWPGKRPLCPPVASASWSIRLFPKDRVQWDRRELPDDLLFILFGLRWRERKDSEEALLWNIQGLYLRIGKGNTHKRINAKCSISN